MSKIDLKTEIKLCKLEKKEYDILIRKYEKKVADIQKKKIQAQCSYETIEEVQEAYGYGDIDSKEYQSLCNFFGNIEDEKTLEEMFLDYLKGVQARNLRNLRELEQEVSQS